MKNIRQTQSAIYKIIKDGGIERPCNKRYMVRFIVRGNSKDSKFSEIKKGDLDKRGLSSFIMKLLNGLLVPESWMKVLSNIS